MNTKIVKVMLNEMIDAVKDVERTCVANNIDILNGRMEAAEISAAEKQKACGYLCGVIAMGKAVMGAYDEILQEEKQ